MVLIASFLTIIIAIPLALFLRFISRTWVKSENPFAKYYFTGVFLSIFLAITPALIFTLRNYGKGLPFGKTETEMFIYTFPLLLLLLIMILVLAKNLKIYKWNSILLFAVTIIESTIAALFMHYVVGYRIDSWAVLLLGVTFISLFIIQLGLASAHQSVIREMDA